MEVGSSASYRALRDNVEDVWKSDQCNACFAGFWSVKECLARAFCPRRSPYKDKEMKAMGDMTAQLLPDIGKSGGGYESDWAEHELTNSEKVSDEGEVQVVVYVKPEVEIDTSSQPYKEEASMGYPVERRSIPDVAADVADGGLDPKYNLSSLKMPSCSEWWQMTDPQQTGASSGNEPTSSQNRNGTDERQSNGTSTGKQTIDTPANSHPEAEFREEAMDVLERMELLVGKRGVVM